MLDFSVLDISHAQELHKARLERVQTTSSPVLAETTVDINLLFGEDTVTISQEALDAYYASQENQSLVDQEYYLNADEESSFQEQLNEQALEARAEANTIENTDTELVGILAQIDEEDSATPDANIEEIAVPQTTTVAAEAVVELENNQTINEQAYQSFS